MMYFALMAMLFLVLLRRARDKRRLKKENKLLGLWMKENLHRVRKVKL